MFQINRLSRFISLCCFTLIAFGLFGCGPNLAIVAEEVETPTWAAFRELALRESSGQFVVDGDLLIESENELHQFYNQHVAHTEFAETSQPLAILTVNGSVVYWNHIQAKSLTYCVSPHFGPFHNSVVAALATASKDWERAANVKFIHITAEDTNCSAANGNVLFNVEPVDVRGRYLARSFFPMTSRGSRNLKIDLAALRRTVAPGLAGILRHEFGHILGFRHEHTRPEARACFEDRNWAPLTAYDKQSVMHYPQCHGSGNPQLELSELDVTGARRVYPF
jgi:hypothetical protein